MYGLRIIEWIHPATGETGYNLHSRYSATVSVPVQVSYGRHGGRNGYGDLCLYRDNIEDMDRELAFAELS